MSFASYLAQKHGPKVDNTHAHVGNHTHAYIHTHTHTHRRDQKADSTPVYDFTYTHACT